MVRSIVVVVAALFSLAASAEKPLHTVDDLANEYGTIFKTGNRNAASHLWTSYILNRSTTMDLDTMTTLFRGYCPVSGSPLPDLPRTQFHVSLQSVNGGMVDGVSHHCCWPCICDLQDSVRVDTKSITTTSGTHQLHVLVIGDPCVAPEKLEQKYQDPFSGLEESLNSPNAAPEVKCVGNKLMGAAFSDGGYPIIGLFVTDTASLDPSANEASSFDGKCAERKKEGYNSGMGLIFHLVADINPITKTQPSGLVETHSSLVPERTSLAVSFPLIGCSMVVIGVAAVIVLRLRSATRSSMKESDSEETSMTEVSA